MSGPRRRRARSTGTGTWCCRSRWTGARRCRRPPLARRAVAVRRARDCVGAAPARGRLERGRRLREVTAVAAVGLLHVGAPDRSSGRAAVAREVTRERMADPDGRREPRRVADEPGVGLALGGSGLAGGRAAEVGVSGTRALGDDALQDVGDLVRDAVRDRAGRCARVRDVRLAVREDDPPDRGRGMVDAAVGERRVGVGLLERCDSDPKAADSLGGDAVERRGDPELLGHLFDVLRADVQVELGKDDVDGVDGRLADVHRPALAVAGVVDGPRRPVVKRERHRALAGVVGGVGVHSLAAGRWQARRA